MARRPRACGFARTRARGSVRARACPRARVRAWLRVDFLSAGEHKHRDSLRPRRELERKDRCRLIPWPISPVAKVSSVPTGQGEREATRAETDRAGEKLRSARFRVL